MNQVNHPSRLGRVNQPNQVDRRGDQVNHEVRADAAASRRRATAVVIGGACQGCGGCLLTCPEHAIRPGREGSPQVLVVAAARCTGCGECAEICPADAIVMKEGPVG